MTRQVQRTNLLFALIFTNFFLTAACGETESEDDDHEVQSVNRPMPTTAPGANPVVWNTHVRVQGPTQSTPPQTGVFNKYGQCGEFGQPNC